MRRPVLRPRRASPHRGRPRARRALDPGKHHRGSPAPTRCADYHHAAPEMDGREIEVSLLGGGAPAHRTHSRVRPRKTGGETQYAAVYPQLAAGDYTIWKDDVTPAATVTIEGGQVTTTCWPGGR